MNVKPILSQIVTDDNLICLNLGSGDVQVPGFYNLDIKNGHSCYPLKRDANSVDIIRASHILEHFGFGVVDDVLRDWVNVLRPGGLMQIAVPDFAWIVQRYLEGAALPLEGYVLGGQTDENDYHKSLWDADKLKKHMRKAGLERIGPWRSTVEDCAALDVSLNLQGYKPTSATIDYSKVCAVLSAPRFAPVMHSFSTAQSFGRMGIDYYPMQGAYWHQVLSEVLEKAVEHYEYIIICDYDSIFDRDHVGELLRLMFAYPEAHAIFPVQYRRHQQQLLGKRQATVTAGDMGKDLVDMQSGHFGLTVIRSEALQRAAKPWFMGIPNRESSYGDGKIDPDIFFWKNWADSGLSVYMAPGVKIGHMEELIVWPDKHYQQKYQSLSDFQKNGTPTE